MFAAGHNPSSGVTTGSGAGMEEIIANIGESHDVTPLVTGGHDVGEWRERRGSNPLQINKNRAKSEAASPIASLVSVSLGHDLSQVVTAWSKLPDPLKAAILAIVKSAKEDGK